MFSDEVQETKKDMVAQRSQYPADLPDFAGRAAVLKMRKNRLVYLKKVPSLFPSQWVASTDLFPNWWTPGIERSIPTRLILDVHGLILGGRRSAGPNSFENLSEGQKNPHVSPKKFK